MSVIDVPDPLSYPTIEEFRVICRICLKKDVDLKIIKPIRAYVDTLNPGNVQNLWEKIKMCSDIKFEDNEELLPENICIKCVNLLLIAHYFKILSITSDRILRKVLINSSNEASIKSEPNDVIKTEYGYLSESDWNDYSVEFDGDNSPPTPDSTPIKFLTFNNSSDITKRHNKDTQIKSANKHTKKLSQIKNGKSRLKKTRKESRKTVADDDDSKSSNLSDPFMNSSAPKSGHLTGYYECLKCNTSFNSKEDLNNHMQSHNGVNTFQCYGCEEVFHKYPDRTQHEKFSCPNLPPGSKYECRKCSLKLDDRFSYDAHIKLRCPMNKPKPKPEADTLELDPMLKCNHCDYITPKRGHLKAHVLTHHTKEKPFVCEICGKGYSMVGMLNYHRKTTHMPREKKFKCSFCPHVTYMKNSLNVHMRLHTGETRYSCELCGKHFKYSSNYHIHVRRHHQEKEIECGLCKKKFSVKRDLKDHMSAVHLGLKPHVCKICNISYSRRRSLKSHSLKIHNITLVPSVKRGRKSREDMQEPSNSF